MAVHADHGAPVDALLEVADRRAELRRHGVADGVGDVDRRRAGVDRGQDDLCEEVQFRACRVLGAELHVLAVALGTSDALLRSAHDLLLGHLELELAVDGRGCQEDVDAWPLGVFERLPGAVDVGVGTARQAGDHWAFDLARHCAYSLKVAWRGDRKAGLDDIDTQILQRVRDFQLLGEVHAAARALLAVP